MSGIESIDTDYLIARLEAVVSELDEIGYYVRSNDLYAYPDEMFVLISAKEDLAEYVVHNLGVRQDGWKAIEESFHEIPSYHCDKFLTGR